MINSDNLKDWSSLPEPFIVNCMSILYETPQPYHDTFRHFGDHLFIKWVLNKIQNTCLTTIHILFDRQGGGGGGGCQLLSLIHRQCVPGYGCSMLEPSVSICFNYILGTFSRFWFGDRKVWVGSYGCNKSFKYSAPESFKVFNIIRSRPLSCSLRLVGLAASKVLLPKSISIAGK